MNTQSARIPSISRIRTEPVQQRSTERVTLLLDAAAALIDENGIDGLTTSDVALRSESSVGVVYRYFPNIQSLLRALAARNLDRFLEKAFAQSKSSSALWIDRIDDPIDAWVEMARTEPGFRALRFGNVIDARFVGGTESANSFVVESMLNGLRQREDGLLESRELHLDIEVTIEVSLALLERAFLHERTGDEVFISRARTLTHTLLDPYADKNSAK
jgi:AcrR family transcriptional regulator